MSPSNNNNNLLEKFFLGLLGKGEKDELDKLKSEDTEFAEQVEFESDLQTAIEANVDSDLKSMLREEEMQYAEKKTSFSFLRIAATLALVLMLGFLGNFLINNMSSTNKVADGSLFSQEFKPFDNLVAPITRSDSDLTPLEKAMSAYEKGDYESALKQLNQLNDIHDKDAHYFYKGNCLLALDKKSEALQELDKINPDNPYYKFALWFKALSIVDTDPAKAKQILESVAEDKTNPYMTKAKILLEKIGE